MSKKPNRVAWAFTITISVTAVLILLFFVAFEQFGKYPMSPIWAFGRTLIIMFGMALFYGMLRSDIKGFTLLFSIGLIGSFLLDVFENSSSVALLSERSTTNLVIFVGMFSVVLVIFYFAMRLIDHLFSLLKRANEAARQEREAVEN
ncbi:hypothetical protein JYU02_00115 [bacterium AH-315-P15]|nr:hypothetical protein [bacterium AH-315-P15]